MKYCKNCGLIALGSESTCRFCGQPLYFMDREFARKKPLLMFVLIPGCLLLALSLVLFLIFGSNRLTKREAQELVDQVLVSVYEEGDQSNFLLNATRDTVRIQVDKVYRKNGNYYADCTATSLDLMPVIRDLILNTPAEEKTTYNDAALLLPEKLADAEQVTHPFTIRFVEVGKDYQPVFPEALVLFCMGNLQDSYPELMELLGG